MSTSIKARKVAIIGAGHVGSHVGYALGTQGLASEVIYIDPPAPEKASAQALDLQDAVSYLPAHTVFRAGTYADISDAAIVVIAAGPLPDYEKGERDRLDTLPATVAVVDDVVAGLAESGFSGIIVTISNPADVIANYIAEKLDWPRRRILSTGTGLDSARLRRAIGVALGVEQKSVNAYMLGEHGENQFAGWSRVTVGGIPLTTYLGDDSDFDYAGIEDAARSAGWTILCGKGSTEFGIATTTAQIVQAILDDERALLPVSAYLDGEYGESGIYASVPAQLGAEGVIAVPELPLSDDEQKLFADCASQLHANFEKALELGR